MPKKLGKRTDQRLALLKNQVSELLWYGEIKTTVARAKAVRSLAEKYITIAMRAYKDDVKVTKTVTSTNAKGVKSQTAVEFTNDGPKKLVARRRLMAELVDIQEVKQVDENGKQESKAAFRARIKDTKHPLIEKIFKEYAPKYDQRKEQSGQGGGYTQILKTGFRRGDAAETCILRLI